MNLTVRIHDKEYIHEVAQGVTFTEEYNETLDSGVVRLSHIKGQIVGLKPYDDVYIYESAPEDEDEAKWFDSHIGLWRRGGTLHDGDETDEETGVRIPFYRHLLVDKFTEDIINLSEDIYSYSLELFSETKGLEVVQLPNISVTQPLVVSKKIDIYTYLMRYVNLYSPKYKKYKIIHDDDKNVDINSWGYVQKYTVAPELKSIFSGFYSQDFSLSNPNLRDVLSSLMITLDMIPYVKDNVIYAKAISERTGEYDIKEEQRTGRISRIVGQMGSSDFCDGVRRQYSDALSQDGTCNFIEYFGFRSNNNALMTLQNMNIPTTHKLYKVKKFNMCFYQSSDVVNIIDGKTTPVYTLSKYDITPLIKEKTEWNLLNQDWRKLDSEPKSIADLAQFKISTASYSIGGKTIEGWGARVDKVVDASPLTTYDVTATYIENILKKACANYAINEITSFDQLQDFVREIGAENNSATNYAVINTFIPDSWAGSFDKLYPVEGISDTQRLKTIFFEIEYEGFYEGAIIHSRDEGMDNIISNDNSSSSLTLLEKDGLSQKEKLNRFANKTHLLKGRLDGDNYSIAKILKLGNTGVIGADDDVIIYRREYSIFNNYVSVSYAGIQDYVLKNFYTSVYAKYRTYQLMSYGESVNRSENRKTFVLLSKNKKHKDENTFFEIKGNKYNFETIKCSQRISLQASMWNSFKGRIMVPEGPIIGDKPLPWVIPYGGILDAYSLTIGKHYLLPITIKGEGGQEDRSGKYLIILYQIVDETTINPYFVDWFEEEEADKITEIGIESLFSAFLPSSRICDINNATIKTHTDKNPFFVDEQTFTSGNNLCFNVAMPDNISGGNFIDTWSADWELLATHPSNEPNYYVGSTQQWYDIVDDRETGAIKDIDYQLSHTEVSIPNLVLNNDSGSAALNQFYSYCKNLPIKTLSLPGEQQLLSISSSEKNICKDNKERIDMTFQIEPIAIDKNIVIGQYLLKLSDLILTNENAKVDVSNNARPLIDGYRKDYNGTSYGENVYFSYSLIITSQGTGKTIQIQTDTTNKYIRSLLLAEGGVENAQKFSLDISVKTTGYESAWLQCNFTAQSIYWKDITEAGITTKHLILKGNGSIVKWTKNSGEDSTAINELIFHPHARDASATIIDYKYEVSPSISSGPTGLSASGANGRSYINYEKNMFVERNMFLEFSEEAINKTIASKILPYNYNDDGKKFATIKPSEVFSIVNDRDKGAPEKRLRVALDQVPSGTQSIRYWYFDFDSAYQRDYTNSTSYYKSTPNRSGYHFVFGVNVTEADFERGYIDIYITKTTNRDERVYDSVGRQVGIVHNCIDSNGNYEPPKYQTFDPTAASPNMVKFDVDSLVDNVLKTNSISRYVGEQVPLQCESEIFESWVIGDQVIKKNSYELTVAPEQNAVQLKLSIAAPTDYSASSEIGAARQYVNLTVSNPNLVAVSVKGNVFDKNGIAKKDFSEEIGANSTSTFSISVSIAVNLQDGYVDFRFEANNISVSPSVRVQIETTT